MASACPLLIASWVVIAYLIRFKDCYIYIDSQNIFGYAIEFIQEEINSLNQTREGIWSMGFLYWKYIQKKGPVN